MNRRTFFKNMLGAAFVASIPVPIFNAIVTDTPPQKFPKVEGNGLWLFDENDNCIAVFNETRITFWDSSIPFDNGDGYMKYIKGLKSLDIKAWNIQKIDRIFNIEECMKDNRMLQCVIKFDDLRCFGDVYIIESSIITHFNHPDCEIYCTITGPFTIK